MTDGWSVPTTTTIEQEVKMLFATNRTLTLTVPPAIAVPLLPEEIAVGAMELRTDCEPEMAVWRHGSAEGAAVVSFRPTVFGSTMTLALRAPRGLRKLGWPRPRLALHARRLAALMAYEIVTGAEAGTGRFRARRVPASRAREVMV
jgi:hypothetical protein